MEKYPGFSHSDRRQRRQILKDREAQLPVALFVTGELAAGKNIHAQLPAVFDVARGDPLLLAAPGRAVVLRDGEGEAPAVGGVHVIDRDNAERGVARGVNSGADVAHIADAKSKNY